MTSAFMNNGAAIDWLMEGDPGVRWQLMRDLLDASPEEWEAERLKMLTIGWGTAFLAALQPDMVWPEGRWTGTIWTLLTLMDLGFPNDHEPVCKATRKFLQERDLTPERTKDPEYLLRNKEICHLGFWLRAGSVFTPEVDWLPSLALSLIRFQMADGGWNCRIRNKPKPTHSSFHTTFNVLEGLTAAADSGPVDRAVFRESEKRALEFMLAHRLYRSDKTGQVIHERFLHLSHPHYWHYTVLRGLDYMRRCPEIADSRLEDPIGVLEGRRDAAGRWPLEKRISGAELFHLEKTGESRWNTLRVLRVLKARGEATEAAA